MDLDSSIEQHRTVVNPGVDADLDSMKETYAGMDSLLDEVAVNIACTIPEEVGIDINVIYFPQLGFNIAIPLDESGRVAYDGGDEAWDQVFTTENRAYFKDFRMREMDEKLGDMYGLICGECTQFQATFGSPLKKLQKKKSNSYMSLRRILLPTKRCLWRLQTFVESSIGK